MHTHIFFVPKSAGHFGRKQSGDNELLDDAITGDAIKFLSHPGLIE